MALQGVEKFRNTETTNKKMFPHGRLKLKGTLPCSKHRVEVIDRSVSRNIDTESSHPRLSSAWNYYIHLYRELVSSLQHATIWRHKFKIGVLAENSTTTQQ